MSCKSSATVPRTASHSTSHSRNGLLFPQCARCRMVWMDPDLDRAGQSPPMTVCVWRSATTVDRCHCVAGTGRKAGEVRPVRKQILCRRTEPLSHGPGDHRATRHWSRRLIRPARGTRTTTLSTVAALDTDARSTAAAVSSSLACLQRWMPGWHGRDWPWLGCPVETGPFEGDSE